MVVVDGNQEPEMNLRWGLLDCHSEKGIRGREVRPIARGNSTYKEQYQKHK